MNKVVEEEFSLRRNKKSIDISFTPPSNLFKKKPFFLEKNVSLYKKNKFGVLSFLETYNLYFYEDNVVFVNKNKYKFVISSSDLDSKKLKRKYIEINFNGKSIILKTKNNNIL